MRRDLKANALAAVWHEFSRHKSWPSVQASWTCLCAVIAGSIACTNAFGYHCKLFI